MGQDGAAPCLPWPPQWALALASGLTVAAMGRARGPCSGAKLAPATPLRDPVTTRLTARDVATARAAAQTWAVKEVPEVILAFPILVGAGQRGPPREPRRPSWPPGEEFARIRVKAATRPGAVSLSGMGTAPCQAA